MNAETLRAFCLSLPHATEDIKWGNDLCFLIVKKMFAITLLEPSSEHSVTFKCTPEKFAELIEMEGIVTAAYMARSHWVTVKRHDALRDAELKELIAESYRLVLSKLPKKVQAELASKSPTVANSARAKKARAKAKRRR